MAVMTEIFLVTASDSNVKEFWSDWLQFWNFYRSNNILSRHFQRYCKFVQVQDRQHVFRHDAYMGFELNFCLLRSQVVYLITNYVFETRKKLRASKMPWYVVWWLVLQMSPIVVQLKIRLVLNSKKWGNNSKFTDDRTSWFEVPFHAVQPYQIFIWVRIEK